jgi:hypothetical protein
MAAERSAAIFFLLKSNGYLAGLPARNSPERAHLVRALVAALFPVVMHLHVVANRMVMMIFVGESRAHRADGDSGKCKCEQNFLHEMGGPDDRVD